MQSRASSPPTTRAQESFIFHLLAAGGLTFMVVAEADMGRRVPFAYLEVGFFLSLCALLLLTRGRHGLSSKGRFGT